MESFEALANSINGKTLLHAKELHLSTSTVSKWQEPSTDFSDSGALNPLDRIEKIIETSLKFGNAPESALSPVFYLGTKFNFLPLILPIVPPNLADVSKQLNRVVAEFGHVIKESADALEDGRITPDERRVIESEAQHLMSALGLFLAQISEESKR